MKQVREVVGGGLLVVCFACEEKDSCDGEPVQVSEDRGGIVSGMGVCVQAGWGLVDILKFIEDFG